MNVEIGKQHDVKEREKGKTRKVNQIAMNYDTDERKSFISSFEHFSCISLIKFKVIKKYRCENISEFKFTFYSHPSVHFSMDEGYFFE